MANLSKQRRQEKTRKLPPQLEPRVALFARVSSDKQSKEATIDRQRSLVKEAFTRHFNPQSLVGEYYDEGYNLEAKDESRKFWQMLEGVKNGTINTIIVASEDRIFRGESAELRGEITDALRHNGVRLITSNSDSTYSRSGTTDRLVSSITQELGAINKLEAVKTLQHGRRRKLKEQAKWRLTICPYGLRCERRIEGHEKIYDYRIVEEEAKFVCDIYRLYVGEAPQHLKVGETVSGRLGAERIAQILNANKVSREAWIREASQGVGTPGWDKQRVLRILLNETYAGRLTVVFPASVKVAGFQNVHTEATIAIPTIVDDHLFKKAQTIHQARRARLLDDRSTRTDVNFLHGLLRCPICDAGMRGRVANAGLRYYGCPNTSAKEPHPLLRAEDYESKVEASLVQLLSDVNFAKLTQEVIRQTSSQDKLIELRTEEATLQAEKESLTKKKLKVLVGWEDELIDDATYRARTGELKGRDLEIAARLEAIATVKGDLATPHERLMTLERVKRLLDEVLMSQSKTKYRVLKLVATELVASIKLTRLPPVTLTVATPQEEVSRLLTEGRITAKDVRMTFGLQPKEMLRNFGKQPRKVRLAFEPVVLLKE